MPDKELKVKKLPPKKQAKKASSNKPPFKEGKHVLAQALADMLDLKVRQIRNLKQEGILVTEETTAGPRYLLVESLVSYIKSLKTNQDKAELDIRKASAEARIKEAKAEKEEIDLNLLKGNLHKSEHVKDLFDFMITQARSNILPLSSRCAIDCSKKGPVEVAAIIDKEVHAYLTYLSTLDYDPAQFAERVKEEGGITSMEHDDEDDHNGGNEEN